MATTKAQQLVAWAESKIGCGYVWGATGQVLTQSALKALKDRYPDNVDIAIVSKWLGKQVFDCASFNSNALKSVGISVKNGATTQWQTTVWEKQGTIDTLPTDKVALLYRQANGKMQHTGLYCGNGYFIDARGSNAGVVKNKLSSYKWTHWGIPKGLYDNINIEVGTVLYQAKITANSGKVNLRASTSSSSSRLGQMSIGDLVEVLEETNPDWHRIKWNGIIGYVSTKYITKEDVEQPGRKYFVSIECESEDDAKKLASQLNRAEVVQA